MSWKQRDQQHPGLYTHKQKKEIQGKIVPQLQLDTVVNLVPYHRKDNKVEQVVDRLFGGIQTSCIVGLRSVV